MFRRFTSLITVLVLAAAFLIPQSTQAFFWRNAGLGSAGQTSPSDPTVFGYGYGYGSSGYGYGYGYGYSYYNSDKSGTGYYGNPTQFSSAAVSSDTTVQTADLSPLLVNGSVTLTGSGRLTLRYPTNNSTLSVILAAGSTISGTGWDGILQGPMILDVSVSANSRTIQIGSPTKYLTVSPAATVRIPLLNYSSGTTYVSWSSRADTGESSEGATCTIVQDSDSAYYCEVTTTHFSNFWAQTTTTPTSTPPNTSTGGGGGIELQRCKDKLTGKMVTGKAMTNGYCAAKEAKKTMTDKPKAPDMYKGGEVAAMFKDTANHWAKDFIETLRAKGIVHGKKNGLFAPNDKLTRAELTKIALNAFGIPVEVSVEAKPFKDVEVNAWFAPYVAKAKELNIVSGYNDGTFKPNQTVNRVEALKILIAASGTEVSMDNLNALSKQGWSYIHFTDTPIQAWYAAYIDFAKSKGIVNGYGNGHFGPNDPVLRGEVAKMAVKMWQLVNK